MSTLRFLLQSAPASKEGRSSNEAVCRPRHATPTPPGTLSLADLPVREEAWVDALKMDGDAEQQGLLIRLVEIGFLPGQPVRVVARAAGGGDPIAVRIGRSTFALRRGEAALVQVRRTEGLGFGVGAEVA